MRRHKRISLLTLLIALLLALNACTGLEFKDDPRPVGSVLLHAEELVAQKAYADASSQYAIVVNKAPDIGKYSLRYAELLERLDKDKKARKVYKRALERVPEEDPDRVEIIHRLALIDANHLYKLDEAEELLQLLPKGSIARFA